MKPNYALRRSVAVTGIVAAITAAGACTQSVSPGQPQLAGCFTTVLAAEGISQCVVTNMHTNYPLDVDGTENLGEDDPGWDCQTMGNQVCGEMTNGVVYLRYYGQ